MRFCRPLASSHCSPMSQWIWPAMYKGPTNSWHPVVASPRPGCIPPPILPQCHLLSIPRSILPTVVWHSHGIPCICHGGRPCHRRCGAESSFHISGPSSLLEQIRWWHLHGTPPNQVHAFHAHLNSVEPSLQFPVSFQSSFGTRN